MNRSINLLFVSLLIIIAVSGEVAAFQAGRFEKYVSGIVRDTESGLEWYAGPDKNTSWEEAKSWTYNLRIHGGWRMPTRTELKSLYQKGTGSRNMTPLLKSSGWFVWSGEAGISHGDGKAWALDFGDGRDLLEKRDNSNYKRGFAVRSIPESLPSPINQPAYRISVIGSDETLSSGIDPALAGSIIIGFDNRFEKFGNGVVRDKKSGLEWYAGPNKNTSQADATIWANCLNIDGGGWRMPTLKELKDLYQKDAGSRNMTSLLSTTGWWIWSGEGGMPGGMWALDFSDGRELRDRSENSNYKRGFAVRSRELY